MSNLFYESLGRVTWAVGKRRVRKALTPQRSRKSLVVGTAVVAVAVIAAGAVFARAHAPNT